MLWCLGGGRRGNNDHDKAEDVKMRGRAYYL